VKPDISDLVQLIDFPDYYVDVKEGKVYSYKLRGHRTKSLLLCKGTRPHDRRASRYVHITDEGGQRTLAAISIPKLIACATYGCTLDRLPKDLAIYWNDEEKRLEVRSYAECSDTGWRERRKRITETRIQDITRNIEELVLLMKFYEGERLPLTQYLYQRKPYYRQVLRNNYSIRNRTAIDYGIDMAIERLFGYCDNTAGYIHDVSWWIVRTARGYIARRKKEYGFIDNMKVPDRAVGK